MATVRLSGELAGGKNIWTKIALSMTKHMVMIEML